MVEQPLEDFEGVVAQHGVMKSRLPPARPEVRIHPLLEQPLVQVDAARERRVKAAANGESE